MLLKIKSINIFLSVILSIITNNTFAQYCNSSSNSASFCSTNLVSLNGLYNPSSGCANYSDFTNIYTELQLNTDYELSIGLENCSGFPAPKISNVYIDWNANQVFDEDEQVFHIDATSAVLANQPIFSTTISVPANAVEDTIRMRVVTLWSTDDNSIDYSCGDYLWGETEDYSLIISGLISSVSTTNNPCYGDSSGIININSINSPSSNFAYSIDGGLSYFSNHVFSNLPNGMYFISIIDSINGQIQNYDNNPVIINSPNELFVTTNRIDLSCFNSNDGILNASAYGGQAPHSFKWFYGAIEFNGDSISNLLPGNYSLLVSDDNGCTFDVDSIMVNNPSKVVIDSVKLSSVSNYNLSCHDSNDGTVELFASGGTGQILVNWNGIISSQTYYSNLSSGIQEVIVFDNNFCQYDSSIILTAPNPISSSNTILHVGCENENDGSITTNVNGGVSPYSIFVDNIDSLNIFSSSNSNGLELINDLNVGIYTLSIIDSNYCTYFVNISIENPSFNLSTKNVECFGDNSGEIFYEVNLSSDTFNLISPDFIDNLSAGQYNFIIENSQGCRFDSVVTITQPTKIELQENVSIICQDSELSNVKINATGGVPFYNIFWNTGDTIFNPQFGIGIYSYNLFDQNNCLINSQIEVIPASIPELSYNSTIPSCKDNFDANIEILVSQGYPPYNYNWQDDRDQALIDSLPPNTYRLTVSDSAGCYSDLLEIKIPYVYNDCFFIPDAFTPNDDGLNDIFEISSIFSRQPIELSIYDKYGNMIFFSNEELKWDGTNKNNKCQIGRYFYHLKYANQYTTGSFLLLE